MNTSSAPLAKLPWWMTTPGIALGFLVPVLCLIVYAGEADLPGLTVRGLDFITPQMLLLGIALLLVMALAGWVGAQVYESPSAECGAPSQAGWDLAALVVGAIACAAYAIWFRDFLFEPSLLLRTLTGNFRPDRDFITLTPGITSLANLAPAFFSIYAYRLMRGNGPSMRWPMHTLCAVLLLVTVFRVYAWSERLAMIEAAVAFALAAGLLACARARPWTRPLVWLGPFAAMPALILYFGVAESVRSWTASAYSGKTDFWDFAIGRLASYYYTSLNNGAGLLATLDWPTWKFEYVLTWLHNAPIGLGSVFSEMVDVGPNDSGTDRFLATYGDEEFNNPSGLFSVVCDLGLPGGFAYFAVLAMGAGYACQAYRRGSLFGIMLYPMFFLSFLEVFRYPYFGTPRAFTWMLGILLAWAIAAAATPARGLVLRTT